MSRSDVSIKDITPRKAFNYLRSKWRKWRGGVRIPEEDLIEFSEMITYRAFRCPQCVTDGQCKKPKGCGCPVPHLFAAPGANCGQKPEHGGAKWNKLSEKNWKESWREFKKKEGLLINFLFSK